MKNIQKHEGILTIEKRLPNSINGNPRFAASIENGENRIYFVTKTDDLRVYDFEKLNGKKIKAEISYYRGKMMLSNFREFKG